jgi:hypothetical protein
MSLAPTFDGPLTVTFVAGNYRGSANGIGSSAQFQPGGTISISPNGLFALVADSGNHILRHVVTSTASVTTLAGVATSAGSTNGVGTNAGFSSPHGTSISSDNSFALITDSGNHLIRKVVLSTASVTVLAGLAESSGAIDGIGTNSRFNYPCAVTSSPDGSYALVADYNNNLIRKISLGSLTVTTLVGDHTWPFRGVINGIGTNSKWFHPQGIVISSDSSFALVADSLNHAIRRIDLSTASVTTLAGEGLPGRLDGIGTNARFTFPSDLSLTSDGLSLLVADTLSDLIRHLDISTGTVTRVAGSISSKSIYYSTDSELFQLPQSISIAPDGSYALVIDNVIWKLTDPSALTAEPTLAPTTAPTTAPTVATGSSSPTSAPTMHIPDCAQFLSFDDSHGTYGTWMTSFLKYDGNFAADDDDDFGFRAGYIPFMSALEMSGVDGVKPAILLAIRYGPGATFSVVPGKLDSHGLLMPCEVQDAGSGPCFTSHSWEMGLTAKSLLNSVYSTETSAWIAPYGSSMTNECFPESEMTTFTDSRLRPAAFTGEGRSHNNLRPPSFHATSPPLPHESVELSLTLRDGAGQGWWNTLKFHPNQYVLDDGEEIIHQGTLVDKAEDTVKVQLI